MNAIFIDRDGTLGGDCKITLPNEFDLFPEVKDAIKLLKKNYILIAVTNQPMIASGQISYYDFEKELYSLGFDDVCICPHKHEDKCKCRKPNPYMVDTMIMKYNINRDKSYIIGDRWSDMQLGFNTKIKTILVLTGMGIKTLNYSENGFDISKVSFITDNLLTAAKIIRKSNSIEESNYKL